MMLFGNLKYIELTVYTKRLNVSSITGVICVNPQSEVREIELG